jgi:23S rRNA pseudouridine1911/1915/1917 synthase
MISILFEDNHLLILDKPANLATQPSLEHKDCLETRAKNYIKKTYHKEGDVFLHAIHRLDKDVSGIVIFAKTSKALSRMNAQMREGDVIKIYRAEVHGVVQDVKRRLCHFLKKGDHKAYLVKENEAQAQESILIYTVMRTGKQSTSLEIQLETGRYHQIRAQLSAIGHPILGDIKYGSTVQYPNQHIKLQHMRITFIHPVTKVQMIIESALKC